MNATQNLSTDAQIFESSARIGATNWLWRPWFAKLWWASIPMWWAGMAASAKIAPLADFYDGALAGFLNILFFPMTALMVLGVGYVQQWFPAFPTQGDGTPLSDEAAAAIADLWEQHECGFEDLNATTDILDPRSGSLYIGNPISPNNGARISVS